MLGISVLGTAALLILITPTHSAIERMYPVYSVDGKCFDNNVRRSVGSVWYDSYTCVKYVCKKNKNDYYFVKMIGCDPAPDPTPTGCKVVTKPWPNEYPRCCPKLVCS